MARALPDQDHTATQAATLAGFPSYESLRRVFFSCYLTRSTIIRSAIAAPAEARFVSTVSSGGHSGDADDHGPGSPLVPAW